MIVLFLLFLLQFSLACACLAVNSEQEIKIATSGWSLADNKLKSSVQYGFECCGFQDASLNASLPLGHPSCDGVSSSYTEFLKVWGKVSDQQND